MAGVATTKARARRGAPGAPRILSTLYWPLRAEWMAQVDVLDRSRLGTRGLLRRIATACGRYDAVVVDGATGGAVRLTDLGGAALLAHRRDGPAVVVTDATWKRGTGLDRLYRRASLRAIDGPRVTYCVLSSGEVRLFPRTWRVPEDRVAFTPFYFTATDEDLAAPCSLDGGVFAGGDSLRDYGPLLRAVRGLDAQVILATGALGGARDLPATVRVGRVSHPEFMSAMRRARVVVVPLAASRERSAGQQTYLNAMAMGKLVVVPDVLGVRDYVEHGRTGLVVPPEDVAALRSALDFALDPARRDVVSAIGERARSTVRSRFGPDQYVASVLAVARRAAAAHRARSGRAPSPPMRPAREAGI